jgi:histidyl-tRNA synthetase
VERRLAHAGLLKTFLEGLGLSGEKEAEVLDHVFAGNLNVLGELKGKSPELEKKLQRLFGSKGNSPKFVENLRGVLCPSLPALGPSLDELARIAGLLTGVDYKYQIDFTSGRGFEYYTGIIFGFYSQGRRLGGGGRYDELIPLVGGKNVCASGFALYIDELMALLKEKRRQERILVRAKDAEGLKPSLAAARSLRDAGYVAEFDLGYRETAGFRWIVNMRSGDGIELLDQRSGKKRRKVSLDELIELLKEEGCR